MQTQPLPLCNEYEPLDANLEELEEPGATFLQDFIVIPRSMPSDTPLSHSNGYTSEESDYSVVTPSDEQNYQDMSFLQAANTSELVDVVGDLITEDLTTVATNTQQCRRFTGKAIKGKTSKYRGVTQTSKTSWGAKYSAKRITNTCKTPEEAAHAYDEYLKVNYPQKYAKFANFCYKCGKFVNPLGLLQFLSECECSMDSPTASSVPEPASVSPKKEILNGQQVSTPRATPILIPPLAPSRAAGFSTQKVMETSNHSTDLNPADDNNATFLSHRLNNSSAGSLNALEDTEQFFNESYNRAAKMSSDRGQSALATEQQQQHHKRDSLPMAIISSAGDSFTQEGNLDQIISDIGQSSSSHWLSKGPTAERRSVNDSDASFVATGSSSSEFNNYNSAQVESNSLDFDVDELDELTSYFLSETDAAVVMQREMQAKSVAAQQNASVTGPRKPKFKKIHSLDFDSENGSSRSGGPVVNDVKLEGVQAMNTYMATPVSDTPGLVMPPGSPAIIDFQTQFLEKYWRNDRKNIQCFPYCPEHGDYYRVRIENLQHRGKGACRAPVKARVSIPTPAGASLSQSGLIVLARCNSTFSRNVQLTKQQTLNLVEMKTLQSVSAIGVVDHFAPLGNGVGGVQFGVTFYPDVWKFEFDLPKKRRHVQSSSPTISSHCPDGGDAGCDSMAAEFMYFCEIDVFYSRDKTTFERLGHKESMNFQIGNTRTLLRQRNKMVGGICSSGGPQIRACQNDHDKLMDADELPEKKKVKVYLGQREILSGTSLGDDGNLSSRGVPGSKSPTGYIPDEGLSPSSKRSLLNNETMFMDVDEYFSHDSKDSMFPREVDSSDLYKVDSDMWKNVDGFGDGTQQLAAAGYCPCVSPKQKGDNIQTACSRVATAIPVITDANARLPAHALSATMEAYSLRKLLGYSLLCVPLSVLFIPVGVLLLLGFVVLPPAAPGIICILDMLSDFELSRANSSCISGDQRLVLNRLVEENVGADGKPKGGMFRYHGKGEVWRRMCYFSGAKFTISMASLVPALVLTLLAGVFYPIRPASATFANAACSCALWSREYTRETTGKRLTGFAEYVNANGLV